MEKQIAYKKFKKIFVIVADSAGEESQHHSTY